MKWRGTLNIHRKFQTNLGFGFGMHSCLGVTLARLVFSGIMDRYPDLKVITHHAGGMIPHFSGRVASTAR